MINTTTQINEVAIGYGKLVKQHYSLIRSCLKSFYGSITNTTSEELYMPIQSSQVVHNNQLNQTIGATHHSDIEILKKVPQPHLYHSPDRYHNRNRSGGLKRP